MSLNLIKSFHLDSKRLTVYGSVEEPLFMAKEVGEFLDIKNIYDSLTTIPKEWKVTHVINLGDSEVNKKGTPKRIYLKEPALYKIAFRSNKEEADKFTNWVSSEVLQAIRKTGTYKSPERTQCKPQLTFKIQTERDLHYKVVNFIKNIKAYDLVLLPSLGELQNDTTKRIEAFKKGYIKGTPDLIP